MANEPESSVLESKIIEPKVGVGTKTGNKKKVVKRAQRKAPTKKRKSRRGGRRDKPIPSQSFREVAVLGEGICVHGGGGKVRRMTILEKLNRSPTSSTTRDLVTNSSKYKVTVGSYNSDFLELTPTGAIACDSTKSLRERRRAEFELAVRSVDSFSHLYTENVNKRFPAKEVLRDQALDSGVIEDDVETCVELFVVNCNDLGLLKTIGGAETLVNIDQIVEELPADSAGGAPEMPVVRVGATPADTGKEGLNLEPFASTSVRLATKIPNLETTPICF